MKKVCKKLLLVLLLFSFTGIVSAQSEKEIAIKKVITDFFEGLQRGDTIAMRKTIKKDAILQTTYINNEGTFILRTEDFNKFLQSVASKKPEDKWQENLLSYNIQIDANMANVWTPYEFYFNNNFSHCGVNSFQLFFNDKQWQIIYLIDTRRRKGCKK